MKGRLLPGGGDWFLTRPDGVGEVDVRVTLETDDGALIYMSYRGYMSPSFQAKEQVPPEDRYYVVTPYFETSAPQYAWLQRVVTVGLGGSSLQMGGVGYRFFAVQ